MRKVYDIELSCCNCKMISEFTIPFGVVLRKYFNMSNKICYNCGCEGFK